MPITLAVSDNADDTGGLATITGADPLETVTVYSQTVDGELGTATWTSRGTRVGNGTIALTPARTYYWWKAEGTVTLTTSNLVYQNLTSGTAAVWYRCLTGTQTRIQGLSLSGIVNASVVIRKVTIDRYLEPTGVVLPAIVIAPLNAERMNPLEGVNVRDDVGYPVGVTMFDNDAQALSTNLDRLLLWREKKG